MMPSGVLSRPRCDPLEKSLELSIQDCEVWSEPSGGGNRRDIVFSLPGTIDLYGIKHDINNYQQGHERFKNIHGHLSVACDFCVRYSPRDKSIREVGNGFRFRSKNGWPEFKGREFTLFDILEKRVLPAEDEGKAEIIRKISCIYPMDAYLKSFFSWVDESFRHYGKRFYHH